MLTVWQPTPGKGADRYENRGDRSAGASRPDVLRLRAEPLLAFHSRAAHERACGGVPGGHDRLPLRLSRGGGAGDLRGAVPRGTLPAAGHRPERPGGRQHPQLPPVDGSARGAAGNRGRALLAGAVLGLPGLLRAPVGRQGPAQVRLQETPPKHRYLISRNSSIPYFDPSRPSPDSFTPPNGATSVEMRPVFTPTMPYSRASATRHTRAMSRP